MLYVLNVDTDMIFAIPRSLLMKDHHNEDVVMEDKQQQHNSNNSLLDDNVIVSSRGLPSKRLKIKLHSFYSFIYIILLSHGRVLYRKILNPTSCNGRDVERKFLWQ